MTKTRRAPCYKINPSGIGRNCVLVVLLGTLILVFLVASATSARGNSQAMVHETGRWTMPFDSSRTVRMFWMTESGDVQKIIAGDQRDNGQVTLIQEHPQREAGLFTAGDFSDQGASPGTDTPLLFSSNDSPSEEMGSDRGYTLPREEKALSNQENKALSDPSRDWKGLGRDTAYFMGYQVAIAGVLYALPESVTNWTQEQKRATVNKWAENVQNPHWDKDQAWINYIGHPYWGATYYIRARERGFGEFGSFWYSAFLSALYEFGIEAFFEQPSYQDLIVTPVGGILIGKFVFEPIRASIKSKTELAWSDHLLLILTDPLGAANGLVDRTLGIKSNVRLTVPGLTPLLPDRSSYHTAMSLKRQDEHRSRQHEFGIGFDLRW